MAHLSLSPPKGSTVFNPVAISYERSSKDGNIPVMNLLLGSHYNAKIGGEINVTSTGNIGSDTLKAVSGKLEIAAKSNDSTLVEKIGSFNSFMYFFPSMKIAGHSEIQDPNVGGGPVPVQRIRYEFEDLATNDKIRISIQGGNGNANLTFAEVVNGVENVLVTQQLTAAVKEINWELDFKVDGVDQFWYKEPSGAKTRIFNGTLTADIAEAKCSVRLMIDQTSVKTVKSDFIWVFYPSGFLSYDISNLADKELGRIRVFDTMNSVTETDWVEVFSADTYFTGERVIENGLIRLWFKKSSIGMEYYGWTGSAWALAGKVIPINSAGSLATVLHDVIFERYNDSQISIVVKYGLIEHIINLRRGNPHVRIWASSKKFRIETNKQRFAVSVDNTSTDIPDFNQLNTDDANRGNPLNLSPTVNPFVFTNDSNATTGLLKLDDNWFAWYTIQANDMVGWLGASKRPTGLTVTATSATVLEKIDWTFDVEAIVGVGVLFGQSNSPVNGIPAPLNIGATDTYVKWRANESVISFDQRMFLRKKR